MPFRPHLLAHPVRLVAAGTIIMSASHASAAEARFDLEPFTAIEASAGIRVFASPAEDHAARVEADNEDMLERLQIEVRDGTLHLSHQTNLFEFLFEGGIFGMSDGTYRNPVTVHVTLPLIEAATASSGAYLNITEVPASPALDIEAQSGAEIEWTGIDAHFIDAQAASGGMAHLSGACDSLDAEASSGGGLAAKTLSCQTVGASASSGGQIALNAEQSVEANASTGGAITIHGQPQHTDLSENLGGQITLATR